ncbi:sensor histidine kinase [Bacillus sp. B1-b2]|uniref:sensor histidine kinase n=1 Tax=Bacillus sp. B1-b2 TaxID=2653201 RepID=UPI0012614783|nr:HAMP domain-containing sensor histidine kinase [Bacillus sp. B1-b2]KAB7666441.1 HAMP domain-containing histidine kinase [Bacillus sp. B1-b2]
MFRKTRINLTILNSLVFILLMIVLGSTVYHYTEKQTYREVNNSLLNGIKKISLVLERNERTPSDRTPMLEPQINLIQWDKDDHIEGMMENSIIDYTSEEKQFRPIELNKLEKRTSSEGYTFQTISTTIEIDGETKTIQLLRNIDSEESMLHQLILIMTIGVAIGSLFAVVAGYLLAGRALVPIQRSWEAQQQFVSDASHEIRTPLAVIQSRTDLLFREPDATVQEKAVDISVISKETRRLSKLVTNLLTLARSDSNQVEITKTMFSLEEVLQEVVLQYEDIADFQGKKIYSMTKKQIPFNGDKERIHQMLVILVDNSMKFTDEGGEIILQATEKANSVVIEVKDNGMGIPKEDLSKIFNRFYQVEQSRTNIEGTGLGLSIAKWIVEKHDGVIKAESILGKGTSFEITFPK